MRPEIELLLKCVQPRHDREDLDSIKSIGGGGKLDWAYLIHAAEVHRVAPLFYWRLNSIDPTLAPKAVMKHLQLCFCANAARNKYLTEELVAILESLELAVVPAIAYKGPVLAALIYGNVALRVFADLDVLVNKVDIRRSEELLAAHGYHLDHIPRYARERTLIKEGKPIQLQVDLHWGLTGWSEPFPVDLKSWWARVEPVQVGSTIINSFSPSDLVLYLCTHSSNSLAWIADLAGLLSLPRKMDFDELFTEARKLRVRRMLFVGLHLSRMLGIVIPDHVLQVMQDDPVSLTLAKDFQQRLFSPVDGRFLELAGTAYGFRRREYFQDRATHFVYALHSSFIGFPDSPGGANISNVSDPSQAGRPRRAKLSSAIWSMLRPIRLFRQYGVRPLKSLFRGR